MNGMNLAQWQAAGPWLDEVLDLAPGDREAWLAALERERPEIAATLREFLAGGNDPAFASFLGSLPGLAGRRFGAYVIEREIGEGGMGSVWLARRDDGRFEGQVAIKLPSLARLTQGGSARFAREGALLGRLSHPHIARLLDAGIEDGQPYLVLEYVEGQPIDAWCDGRALDVRARVRLFLDVIDAVAHAHVNLVLHRDLKPSNILVDGEGHVKLLDFGVAKLVEEVDRPAKASELTREAGHAFTPAFAAPEQRLGDAVTTATDVYAMGVLLYLLLSGRHPFPADADPATTEALSLSTVALQTAPDAAAARASTPPRLARDLRGDLENVVGKAIRPVAGERYPTAAALGEDLRRYLEHLPVVARGDSLGYRAAKFVRRHRYAVGAASATALALVAGITATTWQAIEARRQREAALLEARRADESRLFMRLMVSEVGDGSKPLTGLDILERGTVLLRDQERRDPRFVADEMVHLSVLFVALQETRRARELAVEAEQRARQLGEPDVLARALCAVADVDLALGKRDDAERRLAEARSLLAGRRPPAMVAAECVSTEANALDAAGDSRGAIARAQQGIDLLMEAGKEHHPLRSALLTRLSKYHDDLGERRLAFEYNQQAARAMLDDGTAGTLNGLVTGINHAADLSAFGEFRASLSAAAEVVAKAAARGDVPVDFAANYGAVLGVVGRFDEAHAVLDDVIGRAAAAGNRFWELRARFFRARLLVWQGRLAEADTALAEVEREYGRDPEQNRIFLASALATRADWLVRSGRTDEAFDAIQQVLERIGYPDDPSSKRFSNTLVPLAAQIALAAGDLARATALARAGVGHAEAAARDVEQSGDVGRARLVLGKVLLAEGDSTGGRAMLQSALPPLVNGFGEDHWLTREARATL